MIDTSRQTGADKKEMKRTIGDSCGVIGYGPEEGALLLASSIGGSGSIHHALEGEQRSGQETD